MLQRLRRHPVFAVLFVIAGITLPFGIREGNDWGGDFGIYIQQARNFSEHRPFYQSSYVPTDESLLHQPAVYPPLSSLILAPVYGSRGLDYRAMKLAQMAFLWFSLPLYYAIGLRRGISGLNLCCALTLFLLTPTLHVIGQSVGSDYIFLFFSALALLVIDVIYDKKWDQTSPVLAGTATAIVILMCYFTRATGMALIGGFALYDLWRARRIRWFNVSTGFFIAACLAGYLFYMRNAGGQYGSQFRMQPRIWADNGIAYLKLPAAIWAGSPAAVRYPVAFAALCVTLTGIARRFTNPALPEFYFGLWLAVLLTYSVSDTRYMLPAIPFLLMYAAETLQVYAGNPSRVVRLAAVAVTSIALATSAANLRIIPTGPITEGATQPSFADLCAFLKSHTPDDGIILSSNPRVIALYTEKKSAQFPFKATESAFESSLPPASAHLLVFYNHDLDRQLLTPYLAAAAGRISLQFENADFRVFAIPGPRR